MINSDSIVKLNGVFETKNSLYLSMEYLEGATL
jgi:serine/threonine protein kinase